MLFLNRTLASPQRHSWATMAGGRRSSVAASLHLPSVSTFLLLWIFSWNWAHAVAKFDPGNMTALQEHVFFFDANKDGIITPTETREGFIAIGSNPAAATAAAITIHAKIGPKTTPDGAPLPYLAIYIENIHKAIHVGDTGAYDANGRFVPKKFEEIFTKYAKSRPDADALTLLEIEEMLKTNFDKGDPVGSHLEWMPIYLLAKDSDGLLHKDITRGVYDGSVFTKLEAKSKASQSHV